MKPEDFRDQSPALVLEEYFLGETQAWGIFEDRFGNVRRQFSVDIRGVMDGNRLVLHEDFRYADGETDTRIWTIERTGPHTYIGTADDVAGGARGKAFGNALYWSYLVDLKVGGGTWRVRFDDWMFLQDEMTLINRARVSKWGVGIGDVTIFFRKMPASSLKVAAE